MKYCYFICILLVLLFGTEIRGLLFSSKKTPTTAAPRSLLGLGSSNSKKSSATAIDGLTSSLSNLLSLSTFKTKIADEKLSNDAASIKNEIIIPPVPKIRDVTTTVPDVESVNPSVQKELKVEPIPSPVPESSVPDTSASVADSESTSLSMPILRAVVSSVPKGGLQDVGPLNVSKPESGLLDVQVLDLEAPSVLNVSEVLEDVGLLKEGLQDRSLQAVKIEVEQIPLLENIVTSVPNALNVSEVPEGIGLQDKELQDRSFQVPEIQEAKSVNQSIPDLVQIPGDEPTILSVPNVSVKLDNVGLNGTRLQEGSFQDVESQCRSMPDVEPISLPSLNISETTQDVELQDNELKQEKLQNEESIVPVLDERFLTPSVQEVLSISPSVSETLAKVPTAPEFKPISSTGITDASIVRTEPIISSIADIVPLVAEIESFLPSVLEPSIKPDIIPIIPSVPELENRDSSVADKEDLTSAVEIGPITTIVPNSENLPSLETTDNILCRQELNELPGVTNILSTLSDGLQDVLSNLMNALLVTPGLGDLLIYLLSTLNALLESISGLIGVPLDNIVSSIPVLRPLLDGLFALPGIYTGMQNNIISDSGESIALLSRLEISGPNGLTELLNFVLHFLNDLLSAIPYLLGGTSLDYALSGLPNLIGTFETILSNLRANNLGWQYRTNVIRPLQGSSTSGSFPGYYSYRNSRLINIHHNEINFVEIVLG